MRNSNNEVIQFQYGGDGLDPMMMEGKDKPVDFQRVLEHIQAASPYAGIFNFILLLNVLTKKLFKLN